MLLTMLHRAVLVCEHSNDPDAGPINCITNRAVLEGEQVRLRTCHDCDQALYERGESIRLLTGEVISLEVTPHQVSHISTNA